MKFIPIICCLFILSGCSEKRKDEIVIEKKSCIHFTQHSRQLPIVNSAIEIFEGQQFDGVLELKNDSVHFILQPDSNLLEPPKVLVFIDQEEVAPYRELISQQLPSGGYWIYYACYDSLGNECFLPEFYDVDHHLESYMCGIYGSTIEIRIIQNNIGGISVGHNFIQSQCDSIIYKLTKFIKSENQTTDNSVTWTNLDQLPYRWINRSLYNKLNELNSNLKINEWTIDQAIYIQNSSIYNYADLPAFSTLKYAINYQGNLGAISLINQSWNELFKEFKSKFSITQKELRLFTEEERQALPFQVSSPLLYSYWHNSFWQIVPLPPPPVAVKEAP